MSECNFANSLRGRSLDPWCVTHDRSAVCCMRELREELVAERKAHALTKALSDGFSAAMMTAERQLEKTIEAKIERGEANYWDTFDAKGNVTKP